MTIIASANFSAPRPNRFTIFLRTFVLWQFIRFILVNLRMTAMIAKSHGGIVGKP